MVEQAHVQDFPKELASTVDGRVPEEESQKGYSLGREGYRLSYSTV